MKRITSMVLVLLTSLILCNTAFAKDTATRSGSEEMSKLSKTEIKQLLDEATFTMPTDIWTERPSLSGFKAGELTIELQQAGTKRLNAWRRIAGLPSVTLSADKSYYCQNAALIQACISDSLGHRPEQPSGMPNDIYEVAYKGSSSSNLAAGVEYPEVVDELFADHWGRNIGTVGHRRWFLNPAMGSTGFGYVENSSSPYRRFAAVYALDTSAKVVPYDFIAWPASGNFPSNTTAFTVDTPWSVSPNLAYYGRLVPADVSVSLTRRSDGKVWNFSGKSSYTAADEGLFFTVSTSGTGGAQAIIFRPDNVGTYEGLWDVEITIAKLTDGSSAKIAYSVEFFDTEDFTEEVAQSDATDMVPPVVYPQEAPRFLDISSSHWAYHYVLEAVSDGAIEGVTPELFVPDRGVTGYELAAILLRGCFGCTVDTTVSPWYSDIDRVAEKYGLWNGLYDLHKNEALTRFEMAQILCNAMSHEGVDISAVTPATFADTTDSIYEDAVSVCASYGVLQGVSGNRFDGTAYVDRAQAAAIYCRLKTVLNQR